MCIEVVRFPRAEIASPVAKDLTAPSSLISKQVSITNLLWQVILGSSVAVLVALSSQLQSILRTWVASGSNWRLDTAVLEMLLGKDIQHFRLASSKPWEPDL